MEDVVEYNVDEETGWVVAHCKSLGLVAHGETRPVAEEAILEAIKLYVKHCLFRRFDFTKKRSFSHP